MGDYGLRTMDYGLWIMDSRLYALLARSEFERHVKLTTSLRSLQTTQWPIFAQNAISG
jgi:hypothetical protein